MEYLADTHVLLWTMGNSRRLPESFIPIIKAPENTIYYSPISIWEVAIKYSKEKLHFTQNGTPDRFFDSLEESFFECLELYPGSLALSYQLPQKSKHQDPFDRMLVWEALYSDLILMSTDSKLSIYEQDGLRLATPDNPFPKRVQYKGDIALTKPTDGCVIDFSG